VISNNGFLFFYFFINIMHIILIDVIGVVRYIHEILDVSTKNDQKTVFIFNIYILLKSFFC